MLFTLALIVVACHGAVDEEYEHRFRWPIRVASCSSAFQPATKIDKEVLMLRDLT
jgi:hypothetical protein